MPGRNSCVQGITHDGMCSGRIGVYVLAVVAGLLCATPFLWSLITAFKQNRDLYNADNNPFIFNDPRLAARRLPVQRHAVPDLRQHAQIGLLVVAITLALALPAAYALARLNRPWSAPMAIGMFLVYLVPPSLLFLSVSRWSSSSGCRTRSGRWWSSIRRSPPRCRCGCSWGS